MVTQLELVCSPCFNKHYKNKSVTEKEKQTSLFVILRKLVAFQIFLNENMLLAPI